MLQSNNYIFLLDDNAFKYSMIYIFADTDQHEFWIDENLALDKSTHTVIRDIEEWQSCSGKKIALVEILCSEDIESKKIRELCEISESVLIFIPELIDQSWITEFDLPNVVLYLAGKINDVS